MRRDMKKVVTERPRAGARLKAPKGEKRKFQNTPEDELPKGEKIRRKWVEQYWNHKEFTDVLGPLHGYLLKQVGRPWDKVYSEICANLPKGTVTNDHIYSHIWQFVEKDVILIDGKACHKGSVLHGIPIRSDGAYIQLYINPETGLLCKARKGKNRYTARAKIPNPPQPGIKAYPGVQYHKADGIWYEVKVKEFESEEAFLTAAMKELSGSRDRVLDQYYGGIEGVKLVFGGRYLPESKRRLTKKEIKFNNLE